MVNKLRNRQTRKIKHLKPGIMKPFKDKTASKDYPKTLVIRNHEGGMIWQVYHVNNKPEAWILSLNADKNGFECRTLTDHQPEAQETFKQWRDTADFLN
jgi:hypothetical protein